MFLQGNFAVQIPFEYTRIKCLGQPKPLGYPARLARLLLGHKRPMLGWDISSLLMAELLKMLDSMLVPVSWSDLQRRSPLVAERLLELSLRAFSRSLFPDPASIQESRGYKGQPGTDKGTCGD